LFSQSSFVPCRGVVVPYHPLDNGHGADRDDPVAQHVRPGRLEIHGDEARQ